MTEKNHASNCIKTDRNQGQISPQARKRFEHLLRFREKLIQETNGQLFEDSVELLRRGREKRTEQLMQAATGQYGKDPYEEDAPEEQPQNGI